MNKITEKLKNFLKLGPEAITFALLTHFKKYYRNKKFIIIGTPVHENLGDHLITYCEMLFLKDCGYSSIAEIPIEAYKLYKNSICRIISRDSIIIINGGGWMGNIWSEDEALLEDIITSFPYNRVIVFPQSIYFDVNNSNYEEIFNRSKMIINNSNNVQIFVRDRYSYNVACSIYSSEKIILAPDIALYLLGKVSEKRKCQQQKIIGLCLRDDREKSIIEEDKIKKTIKYCERQNYKMINVSTTLKIRIPTFFRERAIHHKLHQFAKCRLIITDRLHGMIFSLLCGVPCIVFDNKTKKISSLYESWLREIKIIKMYNNLNINIENFIEYIENVQNAPEVKNLDINFESLEDAIRNGKNK